MDTLSKWHEMNEAEPEKQYFKARTHNKEAYRKAIQLHIQGFNNKQIAHQLGITEQTIGIWIKKAKTDILVIEKNISRLHAHIGELITQNAPAKEINTLVSVLEKYQKISLGVF